MCCRSPEWWIQIRQIPGPLWIAFALHALDAFCFFALAFNLTLYLITDVGMSDSQAASWFGYWGGLMVVFGIPSGYVIDRIGLKKSMLFGSLVSTVARIALLSTNETVVLASLLVGTTAGAGLFQSPLHIAVTRYSPTPEVRSIAFSLLYTSANIGAIAALLSTDAILRIPTVYSGYTILFAICALVSMITVTLSAAFREIKECDVPAGALGWRDYAATLREKNLWFLMLLVVVMIPSRAIFHYSEALMPIYLQRVYPGTLYGTLLTVNPVFILILTPIAGVLLRRVGAWPKLITGTAIAGVSIFIVFFWYTANRYWGVLIPEGVVVSELLFTVGEAIYSPCFSMLAIQLAPPSKQGLYGGLVPLPGFAGTLMAGWVSARMLELYCPPDGVAETCRYMWLDIGAMAMATPILLALIAGIVTLCRIDFSTEQPYAHLDKAEPVKGAADAEAPLDTELQEISTVFEELTDSADISSSLGDAGEEMSADDAEFLHDIRQSTKIAIGLIEEY